MSMPEEEQSLRECESYIQSHQIQRVLKDCIVQLCVQRPDNPISFLRQYFQKLERVSNANEILQVRKLGRKKTLQELSSSRKLGDCLRFDDIRLKLDFI